jgi:hypothetical protein
MAPEQPQDRSSSIRAALADYEANDANTEGAPQQQVVNGWIARDLLTISVKQQNDALLATHTDQRIPTELVLVVLGVALALGTQRPAAAPAPAPSATTPEYQTANI